jgi:DNA polymerase-3 subunit gamma/tau
LQQILQEEGLEAEIAALDAIAAHATGSLRDAISLVDQLRSYGQEMITLAQVRAMQGGAGPEALQEIVGHLAARDVPAGLAAINRQLELGVEIRQLLEQIVEHLRKLLLIKVGAGEVSLDVPSELEAEMAKMATDFSRDDLLRSLRLFNEALNELKGGLTTQLPGELAFIEAASIIEGRDGDSGRGGVKPRAGLTSRARHRAEDTVFDGRRERVKPTEQPRYGPHVDSGLRATPEVAPGAVSPAPPQTLPAEDSLEASAKAQDDIGPLGDEFEARGDPSSALARLQARWTDVLAEVRSRSFKAEAALRSSCRPLMVDEGVVTIGFQHEFHKAMIEDPEHQVAVEQAISSALGRPHKMRCMLLSEVPAVRAPADDARRRRSEVDQRAAEESAATSESPTEVDPPSSEVPDPIVQEAIETYGAEIVNVTSAEVT